MLLADPTSRSLRGRRYIPDGQTIRGHGTAPPDYILRRVGPLPESAVGPCRQTDRHNEETGASRYHARIAINVIYPHGVKGRGSANDAVHLIPLA